MSRSNLIIGSVFIFLTSCVESFYPDIKRYEDLLVVSGILTNQPGECIVNLTRSFKYDELKGQNVTMAKVSIIDQLGNEESLIETNPGEYRPSFAEFKGIAGQKYQLKIETLQGEVFKSSWEELLAPVNIDSLYYVFETPKGVDANNDIDNIGCQFYLNNHSEKDSYYKWEYQETWEYWIPYGYYKNGNNICWMSTNSTEIMVKSTEDIEPNRIIGFPVKFISTSTNRLSVRYSILVKQYSLNKANYAYYLQTQSINSSMGGLYDSPPSQLIGNIYNITYPEKPVLGFFQVSGVSEKRIFISKKEVPQYVNNTVLGSEGCLLHEVQANPNERCLYGPNCEIKTDRKYYYDYGWSVVSTFFNQSCNCNVLYMVNYQNCYDCEYSGTSIKPSFW